MTPFAFPKLAALAVAAALLSAPASVAAGTEASTATLELGRKVYRQQRCQTCHSIEGVGNRRNPLDGVGGRLGRDAIRKWIVAPKEMNPKVRKRAYDLPTDELDALIDYMMSLR